MSDPDRHDEPPPQARHRLALLRTDGAGPSPLPESAAERREAEDFVEELALFDAAFGAWREESRRCEPPPAAAIDRAVAALGVDLAGEEGPRESSESSVPAGPPPGLRSRLRRPGWLVPLSAAAAVLFFAAPGRLAVPGASAPGADAPGASAPGPARGPATRAPAAAAPSPHAPTRLAWHASEWHQGLRHLEGELDAATEADWLAEALALADAEAAAEDLATSQPDEEARFYQDISDWVDSIQRL